MHVDHELVEVVPIDEQEYDEVIKEELSINFGVQKF